MPDTIRCRARPVEGAGPRICDYVIMCMVCGSSGRLTKLRANNFSVLVGMTALHAP